MKNQQRKNGFLVKICTLRDYLIQWDAGFRGFFDFYPNPGGGGGTRKWPLSLPQIAFSQDFQPSSIRKSRKER
jgi:hypothetical protein